MVTCVQVTSFPGTGIGSQIIGSLVTNSHGIGSQGKCGTSSETQSSKNDDTTSVWEVS